MNNRFPSIYLLCLLALLSFPADAETGDFSWTLTPHRVAEGAVRQDLGAPLPTLGMIIDDGTAEGDLGVNGVAAFQFLWLNRMTPSNPLLLEQIHVLFPADPNLALGDPIDLVVYRDDDGDPSNGAELLAVFGETVQVADGVSFSVYSISLDEVFFPADDLYLGVVPRFIESGVTAPTSPGALDTTTSQGRSWLVTWQGDPPAAPVLPSDDQTVNIDALSPGNWLIRGFGSPAPVVDIPSASLTGLLMMGFLLLVAAVIVISRRVAVTVDENRRH